MKKNILICLLANELKQANKINNTFFSSLSSFPALLIRKQAFILFSRPSYLGLRRVESKSWLFEKSMGSSSKGVEFLLMAIKRCLERIQDLSEGDSSKNSI